jgi:hypothetical protein
MLLEMKDGLMFPQFKDKNQKTDLPLLLDVLERVNNLSAILQGKDLLAHELHTAVQPFKTSSGKYIYTFPCSTKNTCEFWCDK